MWHVLCQQHHSWLNRHDLGNMLVEFGCMWQGMSHRCNQEIVTNIALCEYLA